MLRFAANLSWLFQEWSFLDRFAAAADAGFTAVEFLFPYGHPPDKVAQRLVRHRLTPVLFNAAPGDFAAGERGIASLPLRRDEFRRALGDALRYARHIGVTKLHLMAGIVMNNRQLATETFLQSVEYACEEAARDGVTILLEPINKRDIPNYVLDDFGLAEELIGQISLPNLKLQFDIYHRQILHGDVTKGLEALWPLIGHIQIASVPLRQEPTTGELDDRHIFATLERFNYQGYIGCEYRPAIGTLQGLGWMKSLDAD